jgi:hypothetical protein
MIVVLVGSNHIKENDWLLLLLLLFVSTLHFTPF